MELFFNLVWLAISALLVVFWLTHRNRWEDDSLRSSLAVQFVALALLIVILLPVVSLTDDLQACTMPAESEHLARRSDFQAIADISLPTLSVAAPGLLPFDSVSRPQITGWLAFPSENEAPSAGYLRILGTRPPPVA